MATASATSESPVPKVVATSPSPLNDVSGVPRVPNLATAKSGVPPEQLRQPTTTERLPIIAMSLAWASTNVASARAALPYVVSR